MRFLTDKIEHVATSTEGTANKVVLTVPVHAIGKRITLLHLAAWNATDQWGIVEAGYKYKGTKYALMSTRQRPYSDQGVPLWTGPLEVLATDLYFEVFWVTAADVIHARWGYKE